MISVSVNTGIAEGLYISKTYLKHFQLELSLKEFGHFAQFHLMIYLLYQTYFVEN